MARFMKQFTRMVEWAAVAAIALATTARAQKEQWLDYHVNTEGRGYRSLDLTTNPPPNVKLPKFNGQPYFAHWTTPLDPAGRWLALDRTKKSGLYDRVYFDSNGNGRLDDKSPVGTTRSDQYSAYFEPVRVVFKGEDGPITYHLVLRFMQYDAGDANLMCSSGGYYAGKVDIGGKKRQIELIDGNVNGTFNDRAADMGDSDCVTIEGDKVGERYLGKMIEVDGQFYQIEVARDGAFIKLQKAENVVLGQVRVPETINEFVAFGENGHFVRKPVKGEFSLPVGKYRIQEWKIERKDEKGAAWELSAYNFNDSARFEVAEAKPVSLEVGEPMRAVMEAQEPQTRPGSRDVTKQLMFSLRFQGRYGETLQIMKGNQRPRGPRLTLTSLDGTYRYTNTFEFG
jgi:hypothetical protein